MALLCLSLIPIAGCRSTPRLVRQSVTTRLAMPVDSSSVSDIDWPSTRSSKATVPSTSEDRPGIGIPLRDALAALDLVIVLDQQARAVLDAMHRALGTVGIEHGDDHIAGHGDGLAVGVLHHVLVLDLDHAVEIRLDDRLLRDLRGAADMERAHGELRARLADRLRGDDAHRLAHIDRGAAGEIAPVALGAHAPGGLTGEHGADAQFLNAGGLDGLDLRLFEQRALLDDDLVRGRIAHVLGGGAAEDAALERSHHGAGIDD